MLSHLIKRTWLIQLYVAAIVLAAILSEGLK